MIIKTTINKRSTGEEATLKKKKKVTDERIFIINVVKIPDRG